MDVEQLVDRASTLADVTVHAPAGLPVPAPGHILPEDVRRFYTLCGGIDLFWALPYSARFLGPAQVIPANPVFLPKEVIEAERAKGTYEQEPSNNWYIIVDLANGDYVVIDLSPQRPGLCYRAFWEDYPGRGDTPVIARSFTELLERLMAGRGDRWYFMLPSFVPYGDAYDPLVGS